MSNAGDPLNPSHPLHGLLRLRTAVQKAEVEFRKTLPIASEVTSVRIAADLEEMHGALVGLVDMLEKHWPTRPDRCRGCERCRPV